VGEISVHIYGLTACLETASCCKTDADGKTYDAFADAEQRYRRRYVDLTVNDHVKETFQENKMFNAMRSFFNDRGYLEVETPVLQPILVVLQHAHLSRTTTRLTCPVHTYCQ
jgi:lysyl-tRNA synthetase class 2